LFQQDKYLCKSKTWKFLIVNLDLHSDLAFEILYQNIKSQMYLWILNHNAFSSVGICSELTVSSYQGYFRRSDSAFDGPQLLGISIFCRCAGRWPSPDVFIYDKVAGYFGLAHENI